MHAIKPGPLFLFVLFISSHAFAGNSCTTDLRSEASKTIAQNNLRLEFLRASENDIATGRERASFSSLVSYRDVAGQALSWNTTQAYDLSVLSLGSGPDIYSPLFIFPTAKNYHFVDSSRGWGQNPGVLFTELITRLHSIAPDAKVTLVQKGFLAYSPLETMTSDRYEDHGPWKRSIVKGELDIEFYKYPAIWRVEWTSPSEGKQVRYFHYHVANYDHAPIVKTILNQIGKHQLAGLILMGAPHPHPSTSKMIFNRMTPQSQFYAELDYRRRDDTTSVDDDLEYLDRVLKTFSVKRIFPRDPEQQKLIPNLYFPTTYLLKKSK